MKEKLLSIIESKIYKRIAFFIGLIFLISNVFINLNPQPFIKFGYLGVFVFNLFGTWLIIFPTLIKYLHIIPLTLASALGITMNDNTVSYIVGNAGIAIFPQSKKIVRIGKTIEKYGVIALFFWSLILLPYDIIGLISGYLSFPYKLFIFSVVLGKLVRFLLVGYGIKMAL